MTPATRALRLTRLAIEALEEARGEERRQIHDALEGLQEARAALDAVVRG